MENAAIEVRNVHWSHLRLILFVWAKRYEYIFNISLHSLRRQMFDSELCTGCEETLPKIRFLKFTKCNNFYKCSKYKDYARIAFENTKCFQIAVYFNFYKCRICMQDVKKLNYKYSVLKNKIYLNFYKSMYAGYEETVLQIQGV